MAIQSASMATTTLNSSDAHPKQRSQFIRSIASAPNTPDAPESFDATHVTSSSVKSRGTVSSTSPYYSMAAHVGFFTGGDSHVRVFLPENLCNRSTGLCALVIWEETPYPLPVGCPTDCLHYLTRQYRVMVALGYHLTPLISSDGGPALTGSPFCLCVSYQACVENPIPEVHLPGDPCLDLPGPADTQSLREDDV